MVEFFIYCFFSFAFHLTILCTLMIASFMIVHSCVSLAAIPLFLFLPVCDWLGIVLSLLAYTRSLLLLILLLLLFCNCCFFVSSFSSSSSFLRSVCLSLSFSRALSLFFFFCFSRSLSPSLHLNRHRLSVCVCVCVSSSRNKLLP